MGQTVADTAGTVAAVAAKAVVEGVPNPIALRIPPVGHTMTAAVVETAAVAAAAALWGQT